MKTPEISIIIPAYNAEKYIERTLRSCLSQSFADDNYEIIVIDDGSSDSTSRICSYYKEDIRYIQLDQNKGLPSAINIGIHNARSRYIVRVDADDYVHEDLLKVLYLFLSLNTSMHAVACDYFIVDETETVIERMNCAQHPIGCGIMFRKDSLIEIGLYDESFLMAEEVELRQRFEQNWQIHHVQVPLYRYLKHSANMTRNKDRYNHFINKAKHKNKI